MLIYKLLSERINPQPLPNVLITDVVSDKLRNQIRYFIRCFQVSYDDGPYQELYRLAIDRWRFCTGLGPDVTINNDLMDDMLIIMEPKEFFDFLDVICHVYLNDLSFNSLYGRQFRTGLNDILISNSVGFIVVGTQLVPNTDLKEADEIIFPAYHTLSELDLVVVSHHLEDAYEHFKNHKNIDAVLSAHKALESMVDSLLERTDTKTQKQDFASKVRALSTVIGLESLLSDNISGLFNMITQSCPIRNKYSGHGSAEEIKIPDSLVKYEIDLVASNILFLARLYWEHQL